MSSERPPFHYSLYDLALDSDFELRGLSSSAPRPEVRRRVRIRRAEIDEPSIVDRDPWIFVDAGSQQFLAWAAVGAFRVAHDGLIEVDANPGVPDSLVSLPLLGAVMATLLHRRGLGVFHASAVSVDAHGIALLGDKGAGKSTTAGALVAAGHRLISDDIVALDYEREGAPMLLPANAELKLWPDSGERLRGAGLRRLGRIHAGINKAHYAPASPVAESVKLQRLYLLERRDEPGVRTLPAAEALSQLMRHTYMARFGMRGFGSHLPTYFQHAAHLIRDGKVRVLGVPRGLDRLDELPSLVEADLESTSSPAKYGPFHPLSAFLL
jgi:hypothetical protein